MYNKLNNKANMAVSHHSALCGVSKSTRWLCAAAVFTGSESEFSRFVCIVGSVESFSTTDERPTTNDWKQNPKKNQKKNKTIIIHAQPIIKYVYIYLVKVKVNSAARTSAARTNWFTSHAHQEVFIRNSFLWNIWSRNETVNNSFVNYVIKTR